MFGLKGAGLAGATVALAGGVAYLVWVYATSPRERRAGKQPGGGGDRPRRKGERKEEEEPRVAAAAAAAPVAAASAPGSSEVRRRPDRTERPEPVDHLSKVALSLFVLLSFLLLSSHLRRFLIPFVLAYASVQTPELICDPGPGSGPGWSRKNQPAALLVHRQPGAGRPSGRGLQRRLHQPRRRPRGVPGK